MVVGGKVSVDGVVETYDNDDEALDAADNGLAVCGSSSTFSYPHASRSCPFLFVVLSNKGNQNMIRFVQKFWYPSHFVHPCLYVGPFDYPSSWLDFHKAIITVVG